MQLPLVHLTVQQEAAPFRPVRQLSSPMEAKHQPEPDAAPPSKAGASIAQTVVDLICASHCGLVFWSRHPFEIASELQVRLRASALAHHCLEIALQARRGWVVLSGYVVDCEPARREDGTIGFGVTLLFQSATKKQPREKLGHVSVPKSSDRSVFGLN